MFPFSKIASPPLFSTIAVSLPHRDASHLHRAFPVLRFQEGVPCFGSCFPLSFSPRLRLRAATRTSTGNHLLASRSQPAPASLTRPPAATLRQPTRAPARFGRRAPAGRRPDHRPSEESYVPPDMAESCSSTPSNSIRSKATTTPSPTAPSSPPVLRDLQGVCTTAIFVSNTALEGFPPKKADPGPRRNSSIAASLPAPIADFSAPKFCPATLATSQSNYFGAPDGAATRWRSR